VGPVLVSDAPVQKGSMCPRLLAVGAKEHPVSGGGGVSGSPVNVRDG